MDEGFEVWMDDREMAYVQIDGLMYDWMDTWMTNS